MNKIIHKLICVILFHSIPLFIDLEHIPVAKFSWSKEAIAEMEPLRKWCCVKSDPFMNQIKPREK